MVNMPNTPPRSRTIQLLLLTAAPVVTLALIAVLVVRAFTGAGPTESGASTVESAVQYQQEVDDAIYKARKLSLENRPAQAEAVLRDAIKSHSSDPDLRVALGETLLKLDQPTEAYKQYNQAIGLTKDSAELHFATGTVASVAGLFERAEQHYKMAQILDRANPKYPLYLGQIERKLGRVDAARASLIRAAALEPELAIAWGALADMDFADNKLSMAQHYLDKALELEPASPAWRLLQARILRRLGQPEQAAIILEAMTEELDNPDPMILREQALCMGLLGRQDQAVALYDRAVAIGHPDRKTFAQLNYEAALWHERLDERAQALMYAKKADELGDDRAGAVLKRLASK